MAAHTSFQLALLALQRGLLSQAQLLEAWAESSGQPGGALAELLVRRGWLSPRQRAELEEQVGAAAAPSTAPPPTITPGDARTALPLLDGPDRWGPDDSDEEDEAEGAPGRYARTRLHKEGGMGLVWQARDDRLGRQVALKELRARYEGDPVLRRRFLAEARITGQLEHPGVVPVYELVERPGQAPYYTMRLVRGRTLSQAARDFHEQRRACGRVDWVALRDLLQAFVGVCNTLAYAHARGVVHRDLKGANVVLGDFGEVVVLDWGLAKLMSHGAAAVAEEGPVGPLADGELEQTQQGALTGTLAYMAPEQANGEAGPGAARTHVFR